MDANLKAKWVEALRSGAYRQSNGYLREPCGTGDKFCCLGVLADIQGAFWAVSAPKINGTCAVHPEGGWLKEKCAGGLRLRDQKILSDMNDGKGREFPASFTEIADYIEANIPGGQPLAQGEG